MKTFFGTSSTCFALLLLLSFSLVSAQEIQKPLVSQSPTKGLWIEAPNEEMGLKLGFRLQQQIVFTAPLNSEVAPQTEFLIRRARLQFKGYFFQKKLTYFIQLGMDKGQVALLNAEYRWNPDSNTQFSIGQFFPPVGRQFQTASKNFQMVDRSNVTRFFFTDYDIGVALRKSFQLGDRLAIKTALAATHGEGKNIATAKGGWAYTGRLELLPFGMFNSGGDYSESDLVRETEPKLSLGTAYYLIQDAYTKYGNNDWNGLDDNITEYYFDMVFKYNGLSILAEYIHRTVDNEQLSVSSTPIFSEKISGEGFYIQGGKFISKNLEPTFRISILNPNDANQSSRGRFIYQEKFVMGLNKFIEGHSIKFQTQLGLINEDFLNQQTRTYIEVLAQFSISF